MALEEHRIELRKGFNDVALRFQMHVLQPPAVITEDDLSEPPARYTGHQIKTFWSPWIPVTYIQSSQSHADARVHIDRIVMERRTLEGALTTFVKVTQQCSVSVKEFVDALQRTLSVLGIECEIQPATSIYEANLPVRTVTQPPCGVRSWCLTLDNRLESTVADYTYDGPVVGFEEPPTALGARPGSGFYSMRALDVLSSDPASRFNGDVLGIVSHFGTVVVGECGYRSNRMRVDELWLIKRKPAESIVQSLEQRYGCNVHVASNRAEAAKEAALKILREEQNDEHR